MFPHYPSPTSSSTASINTLVIACRHWQTSQPCLTYVMGGLPHISTIYMNIWVTIPLISSHLLSISRVCIQDPGFVLWFMSFAPGQWLFDTVPKREAESILWSRYRWCSIQQVWLLFNFSGDKHCMWETLNKLSWVSELKIRIHWEMLQQEMAPCIAHCHPDQDNIFE